MAQASMQINGRVIAQDAPAFIVAEGACNHMCSLDLACAMVDAAQEAGADAIKFQTYRTERLVRRDALSYWKGPEGLTSQWDYYKRLDRFGKEEYRTLFAYAKQKGILAFSTPFDVESASLLNELGVPVFKVASCDLPDVRLLRQVAAFGKPIILSTGGGELWEVEQAVETLRKAGNRSLALLVCTLSYPAAAEEAHLRRIQTFRERFSEAVIGISDHTDPDPQMVIPTAAVALGARIVEKHFTLDRSRTGSGHFFSMSPADLKRLVRGIRLCEKALGSGEICAHPAEQTARERARRSLVAERPIRKGETLTEQMIGVKRPGTGLPPSQMDRVVGRTVKTDIAADEQIQWDHLAR